LEEDRWRAHVRGGLRRQLAHVARRVHHLRDDLERAERAGALRAEADALAASLHRWPGRMAHVTDEDPEGGESLVIELDPSISVSANMQRRYARAARLERGAEGTLTRLLEGEEQQVVLQALVDQVDGADLLALRALAQRARLGPPDAHRAGPPEPLGGHWRWRDASNHLIRVGRHDAGNQELVFRVARGRDTWLHLKDRPSPHVIVSADGKGGASSKLIDAGEQLLLAAAKVPLGESAEVQRARVADLRAIPGARLGSVRVLRAEVGIATRRSESLAGWTRDDLNAPP
jgi:hypothetical protein